jgi:cyclophilin family peptidyl-prolyl cis-trans isomerase
MCYNASCALPLSRFRVSEEEKSMANRTAVLNTTKGVIKFELREDLAPVTAQNFIDLAERGFYDDLTFHRYVQGFVIQGGDPQSKTLPVGDPRIGTGGSEKMIPLEVTSQLKHDAAGVVAMARSQDPNSASCQFYITLSKTPHLDQGYAVFGKVTEGLDSVLQLREGDRMNSVTIEAAEGQAGR